MPEVRDAEPPGEEAAVADREAETGPEETPGRRKHDGDLGRAALKSEHLRDRSQASLGGGDLVELGESLSPGQPLSEAALDTRHLRDRTRESLGGADLGDLGSSEPGNLGARSLPAGNLRDLSRGEDDRGDFADRSSAR